jgi:X-Pro dipeptidyl-peptidase (S15 family)
MHIERQPASTIPAPAWLAPVLFLLFGGCATVQRLDDGHVAQSPMPVEIANRFCYDSKPVREQRTLQDEKKAYRLFELSIDADLPQFDDDSPVTFEYYQEKDVNPAPVILVLPILNGQKHIVRPFATYFARHGYAAVIVDNIQRETLLDDLADPETAIRQTILRHRRVLDWIAAQPELDANRIAVFGASLGGFNALFLAAADERVRAVAPALVAGDLPFVLSRSEEHRIRDAVTDTRIKLGLDEDEMQEFLAAKIETDPLDLAPYMNADRVLMVLARHDKSVPYEKQLELREAMGNPMAITLPTGHNTAALYIFYLRKRVLRFFDQKLGISQLDGVASVVSSHGCTSKSIVADRPRPGKPATH